MSARFAACLLAAVALLGLAACAVGAGSPAPAGGTSRGAVLANISHDLKLLADALEDLA